jgi:hypothetical protein
MEMQFMTSPSHLPRWYGVLARILLLTFLGTLLCFAVTLLLSLIGTVVVAALRGVHPDMRIAYRHFAVPIAAIEGVVILICTTVLEVRHYQRARTLSAIERAS